MNIIEGEKYKIDGFSDDQIGGKLMTMGLLPGYKIFIIRKAPFGGGFYIKVEKSCFIALSVQEIDTIRLTHLS